MCDLNAGFNLFIPSSALLKLPANAGNKTDREDREIPRHIGEDFAQRHGMYFLETSAKEAENVERLFMEIAVELMEQAKCKEMPKYDGSLGPINGKTTSVGDSSCCSRS
ncbi:ras-related protein Rab-30-like [Choristoneura fumiferana]|uniref:ras-related protein Rab-30-like n=1 Tax=Choristoneura fumiferana TaxID=7141 RepID=UPI003D155488